VLSLRWPDAAGRRLILASAARQLGALGARDDVRSGSGSAGAELLRGLRATGCECARGTEEDVERTSEPCFGKRVGPRFIDLLGTV
jgi:hypothetical protein